MNTVKCPWCDEVITGQSIVFSDYFYHVSCMREFVDEMISQRADSCPNPDADESDD